MKAATAKTYADTQDEAFQSTPPVKAATEWTADDTGVTKISIHAAREGGDLLFWICTQARRISIHAAREGGDGAQMVVYGVKAYFNPRRP